MKANPKNSSTVRESSDEDSASNLLESIGRALALSIRLSRDTLGSRDADQALAMLVGVYSFFALAQAEEQAHSLGLIDALGGLHEVAFALSKRYPVLQKRLMRMVDANGAVTYDAIPF